MTCGRVLSHLEGSGWAPAPPRPILPCWVSPVVSDGLCVGQQDPVLPESLQKGLLPAEAGQGVLHRCQRKSTLCKT